MDPPPTLPVALDGPEPSPLERLASFRFTYFAFCAFVLLNVFTARALEGALSGVFGADLARVVQVDPATGPVRPQIEQRVQEVLESSLWIRLGGVRVEPVAVAADGRTLLFLQGLRSDGSQEVPWLDYQRSLLPARLRVVVSVPHNSLLANCVLIAYAGLFLSLVFAYTRLMTRREQERLAGLLRARDTLSERATAIEAELSAVREQLARAERPGSEPDDVDGLRREPPSLQERLGEVEHGESALGAQGHVVTALQAEYEALEALLDEALADVARKDEEVRALQKQAKQKARSPGRDDERVARRLATLYKNLEVDDRAISDLVALRDETLALRAEESLKRLADESDQAAVRRKVGGLPAPLSIFELGFAGRGRIYYTRGRVRRFRVLLVGDKASQKTDLEYLSRLPRD
jgi:hypothetical protein